MQKLLSIAIVGLLIAGCGRSIDKKTPVETNSTSANNTNNVVANNSSNNVVANNSNNSTTTNNTAACIDIAPTSLNFGEVILGESTTSSITIENCSADTPLKLLGIAIPQGYQGGLPNLEQLAPFQSVTIHIVFQPTGVADYVGEISVQSDAGEVAVSVQGQGVEEPVCPNAVARVRAAGDDTWRDALTTTAPTTVELTGQDSSHDDGEVIERYEWTMTRRPQASRARLTPSGQVMNPSFFADVVGTYQLTLNVFTARTPDGCPADSVTIDAATLGEEEIAIQLVWNTPLDVDQTDDVGSDLDLHYLHPHPAGMWNAAPWDCYWLNRDPDWGTDGSPSVDIDDVDGSGPENITHKLPGDRIYDVGVFYFNDNGFGPSYATVRIYIDGVLQIELKARHLEAKDWFWHVAQIDWATRSIVTIDVVSADGFPNN